MLVIVMAMSLMNMINMRMMMALGLITMSLMIMLKMMMIMMVISLTNQLMILVMRMKYGNEANDDLSCFIWQHFLYNIQDGARWW